MGRGKKTNSHLEKILTLVKSFNGAFTQDEVRRVFKGCNFDETATITSLSALQRDRLEHADIEKFQIENLKLEFGCDVDLDSITTILRECGGDMDQARVLLNDIFPTEQSRSDHENTARDNSRSDEAPAFTYGHQELRFYTEHLIVVFNGRVDTDIAHHVLAECRNNLSAAIAVLSEMYGPPYQFLHSSADVHPTSAGSNLSPQADIGMELTTGSTTSPLEDREMDDVVEFLLQGVLPDSQIGPFLRANGLAQRIPLTAARAKFIVEQVLLVTDACSTADGAAGDLLTDIIGQRDENGQPVDWLLHNVDTWVGDDSGGMLYSLLLPLQEEAGAAGPGRDIGGTSLEAVNRIRSTLLQSVLEQQSAMDGQVTVNLIGSHLTDEVIAQCLEANDGDLDTSVAVLLDTLINGDWTSYPTCSPLLNYSKEGRPGRQKGPVSACTYASILSDPHRRPPDQPRVALPLSGSSERSCQPWVPQIVVSDRLPWTLADVTPSTNEAQKHSQLELYWRDVQSRETRRMQNGFTLASLGGTSARQLAADAHECRANMQCASTEASKHALLARNNHILVDSDNTILRFRGFSSSTTPPAGRGGARKPVRVSIDLHGMDVRNALQFAQSLLAYCRGCPGTGHEIHLIVGRGNNSVGGISRLKPALKKFLQSRNVSFQSSGAEVIAFSCL